MDSFDDEEEKETKGPKFPIQMYISEGYKYFRLVKYDEAIKFFDAALEKEPTNEKSLIGRSKCYMQLAKYSEAKEDALSALRAYPKSSDAKMLIGEAEYFMGDFEKAFLTFYRGFAKRNNHEGLKFGHQMSRKAIDNALDPDVAVTFDETDVEDLARLEDHSDNPPTTSATTTGDHFSHDIDFVKNLLNVKLLKVDAKECVLSHCEFLRNYLKDRQAFWKAQKPRTAKRKRRKKKDNALEAGEKKVDDHQDLVESPEKKNDRGT